jgi:hypothetical protein
MRKPPKTSTILKNISRYAYAAGFIDNLQSDGTIKLFDIKANYYVFRGSRQRAAQFVVDELWMKYHREHPYEGELIKSMFPVIVE